MNWFRYLICFLILTPYLICGVKKGATQTNHKEENNTDVEWKNKFFKDAPLRWEEYMKKTNELQGEISIDAAETGKKWEVE